METWIKRPELKNPILIEGLPGVGFVANISALHLISELNAKKFAEILSPAFQDLIVSTESGLARSPMNELYHAQCNGLDLIILYGNTQALTVEGQYELCGKVLDIVQDLGCRFIICIGGLRRVAVHSPPKVYCTATDVETLNSLLRHGVPIISAHISGVAGVLLGLGKLRGMRGFCLLVETLGVYPDPVASEAALKVLCDVLGIRVDLSRLAETAKNTMKLLKAFGFDVPHEREYGLI